jgi:hypothetical protein
MGQTYKDMKIGKNEIYHMHKKARREADIDNNTPRVKHTVEGSAKDYKRANKGDWKKYLG